MTDRSRRPVRLCVYTRAWRSSGSGLFAQELVSAMVACEAEVTFVSPPTPNPKVEAAQAGLTRLRPPRERTGKAGRIARAMASLARIVGGGLCLLRARLAHPVFVVTIPDPLPFALVMLALLRLSGARIVFVAHDPLPHAWSLPRRLRGLEKGAHGLGYRLASAIVVLSEPSKDALTAAFPNLRRPVRVVEHGVFLLDRPTIAPGSGTLLVFGTLRRNKGIAEAIGGAIRAHDRGVPVRLIVAGGLHAEDRDYGQACADLARGRPDVVDLRIGYVDDAALSALFAQCDALLMPYTDFSSQSGVALLAASNARPIVATAAGGIGALMAEGMPAEAVEAPVSEASVADAIARFLATPVDVWRERAEAYRKLTLERRSWPVIADAYLEVVRRLDE